jgi:HipA-like protein
MNSISNIPNYLLYFIQQNNIQKKITRTLKIDDDDYFGILLITGKHDVIGAVKVVEI